MAPKKKHNDAHQAEWCMWFTPPSIAEKMLQWANVRDTDTILEPAAGEGVLCPDRPGVIAFEQDPDLATELQYWRPEATVVCADFLTAPVTAQVDVSVLNPPYSGGPDGLNKDGEGKFIRRSLLWTKRAVALVRTAAFGGDGRFEACWRYVRPTRVGLFIHRPRYLGPGGRPTDLSPFTDFMLVECVERSTPLPEDAIDKVAAGVELSWLDWR